MCIAASKPVRSIVRLGVITLLVGGTTAVIAEQVRPGSVRAVFHQAGSFVGEQIDARIDDPAALRAQLAELQSEYPAKIAEVRSDLSELDEQLSNLERELAVSGRVVTLTDEDLGRLDGQITRARAVTSGNDGVVVRIAFNERRLRLDQALETRTQIERTREVHATRAAELETEVALLDEQRGQLAELLAKLETERAEFESQIVQLDAQIQAIERGERMLAMMEDRQKTIDEHSRYRAHSLGQLQDRLERVRGEQRARMASIGDNSQRDSYEDLARFEVSRGDVETIVVPAGEADELPDPGTLPDEIVIDPTDELEPVASR